MLYFAYGMNTNTSMMHPSSKRLGVATLPNYAWEMIRYANVYEEHGASTVGILWEIDDLQLKALDMREGFPDFYGRLRTTVFQNKKKFNSIVYFMQNHYRMRLIDEKPSVAYMEMVVKGFAENNIKI